MCASCLRFGSVLKSKGYWRVCEVPKRFIGLLPTPTLSKFVVSWASLLTHSNNIGVGQVGKDELIHAVFSWICLVRFSQTIRARGVAEPEGNGSVVKGV